MRALALVHHYLYESDDVRVVELRLFVGELCQVLHDTLSGAGRQIRIEADVHNMTIASERAVPIALLITEAVTNAYKHAFPDGRAGKISVAIRKLDETSALLTIGDDGVGYSAGEDLADDSSGGTRRWYVADLRVRPPTGRRPGGLRAAGHDDLACGFDYRPGPKPKPVRASMRRQLGASRRMAGSDT